MSVISPKEKVDITVLEEDWQEQMPLEEALNMVRQELRDFSLGLNARSTQPELNPNTAFHIITWYVSGDTPVLVKAIFKLTVLVEILYIVDNENENIVHCKK
jgi:hypothetical protein